MLIHEETGAIFSLVGWSGTVDQEHLADAQTIPVGWAEAASDRWSLSIRGVTWVWDVSETLCGNSTLSNEYWSKWLLIK